MKTVTEKAVVRTTQSSTGEVQNEEADYVVLPVDKIDFSPFNYRKFYDEKALEDFASQVAIRGILSPVIVRSVEAERYQLVAGERRLRAAQIAGLKTIPARSLEFTDNEVLEIQLVENLQRENPHPLHESQAIQLLQQSGKTLEEVARLLGKPKGFIYNRLKLAELIEPLQEVFFAGKLTLTEATELGSLPADAQQEFFVEHCKGWKQEKHFSIGNTKYYISRHKYDLKNAPFNTRDKKLLPEVGACTGCPFNSASLKELFPDLAKQAVCSNKTCFKNKCLADAEAKIRSVLETHQPEALILGYCVSDEIQSLMDTMPEIATITRYSQDDVQVLYEPVQPTKDDYTSYSKEKGREVMMRDRYSAALREYKEDMTAYRQQVGAKGTQKGLLLRNEKIAAVFYNPLKRNTAAANQATAKEVQQAIRENTATKDLLTAEIERLKNRENRSKELDSEKTQVKLHEQFCEHLQEGKLKPALTKADMVGLRLIAFNSLNYSSRTLAEKKLFPKGWKDSTDFYEKLAGLTNEQVAYLIRAVISGNGESKSPLQNHAFCLYKMAEDAGLDIKSIEAEQAAVAERREERLKERLQELQERIKKISSKKK